MLTRIFGESNQKALDQIKPIVEEINSIEQDFHALSDDELRSTTAELRERHAGGESLSDLLRARSPRCAPAKGKRLSPPCLSI